MLKDINFIEGGNAEKYVLFPPVVSTRPYFFPRGYGPTAVVNKNEYFKFKRINFYRG